MTKNISNKLKTLLTLGVVTVSTASSILPVSALTRNNCTNIKVKSNLYLYINGVIYKLPSNPSSPIKPEFKPNFGNNNNNNNNTNKPVNKPNNDNNNNSNTNKLVNKPNNDNTDNNTTNKPVNKPNNDNNNNSDTNKPVNKPNNDNTDNNTTNKPIDKPSNDNTGNFSSYQKQVLDLVNVERTKRGLKVLTLDTKLSNIATMKSQDMIDKNYFDHNSPTYGSPFDMMNKFGVSYRSAGENIAEGQRYPQEVMNAWMNSEGHRKNILNPSFTKLGVGVAKTSSGRLYWTQIFIG